jgi:uncharacterized damage-inducible protein DinB
MFSDAVSGLTAEQWTFKPAPDRWSIAECAEHVAASEEFISGIAKKAQAAPDKKTADQKQRDQVILSRVPDRTNRVQAPEPLRPTNRWTSRDTLIADFKKARDANIAFIRDTQDDLRLRFARHPVFQDLDAYQWYLFLSAHSERHILQIKEVMGDLKFPK